MVPAMRSTAFEVSSGMRVGGVDSFFSILIGLPTAFSISGLTSCSTRAMEKPTHRVCLFEVGEGRAPVRVPRVMVPEDLILSSVSWASTGPAAVSVTARVRAIASQRVIDDLLVSEDLGQELTTTIGLGSREERLGRGLL